MQRSKLGGAGSCYDLVIVAASCMVSQACNGMISLLYIYLSTYLSAHLSIPTQVPIMSNESWMGGMAFIRFMLH